MSPFTKGAGKLVASVEFYFRFELAISIEWEAIYVYVRSTIHVVELVHQVATNDKEPNLTLNLIKFSLVRTEEIRDFDPPLSPTRMDRVYILLLRYTHVEVNFSNSIRWNII